MKIKTEELVGAALDWAVAMCEDMLDQTWPDGGNLYGQEKIKRFAQRAIDAAMSKEGKQ